MINNTVKSWSQEVEQLLLPYVTKPVQYLANEYNAINKSWSEVKTKMAFLFPDIYEIGMSHLGLRILYHTVNSHPDFLLERSFAPQIDMEKLMREKNVPLFTWENYHSVADFDIVGFTLQYEMSFTNILNMLDLAGIPMLVKDRKSMDNVPIIIAGGPCAFNPEPLVDFIDLFILGEGEEVLNELLTLYTIIKDDGKSKVEFLEQAAKIPGIYVPEFYTPVYNSMGKLVEIKNLPEAPMPVVKRIIKDMNQVEFPTEPIVPFTQIIHDRVVLEVMRGCNRGCRFCQAGVIYRPVREKSVEVLAKQAKAAVACSGYDEIGMVSLSTADYSCVGGLIDQLIDENKAKGVSVSLPSLRVDAFSVDLAKKVQQVRKSGLTFAPEAGTQRLRNIINKGVTHDDIIEATRSAIANGWHNFKLYFMAGLPFETQEDLDGIYDLTSEILALAKELQYGKKARPININVSVSFFVPKTHTPFQWFGQVPALDLMAKREYLFDKFKGLKQARLSCHDVSTSFVEAVFSRGDRRLGAALLKAWELGCKFDSWWEHFKYDKWLEAFADVGIEPETYANKCYERDDVLPWEHISAGVSKKWLWQEWENAATESITSNCRHDKCSGCGVCNQLKCDNNYQKSI